MLQVSWLLVLTCVAVWRWQRVLKAHGSHAPSASALLSAGMLYYNSKSPEWLIFELGVLGLAGQQTQEPSGLICHPNGCI